jgi:KaiC/GvpD/RAD55 family RecA-like ATPase
MGFCYNIASRQAEDAKEFRELRQLSVEAYEEAAKIYARGITRREHAKSLQCTTNAEYVRSWLSPTSDERRKTLKICWTTGKKALKALRVSGDKLNYAENCIVMALCAADLHAILSTTGPKRKIIKQGIEVAADAVSILSELEKTDDLISALFIGGILNYLLFFFLSDQKEEIESSVLKLEQYAKEILILSKKGDNPYSKAIALWVSTIYATNRGQNEDAENKTPFDYATEMLQQATIVGDNYLIGNAYSMLASASFATISLETDPERKRQRYEEIIKNSENSIKHLELVFQDLDIADIYGGITECYIGLEREFAPTTSEKLTLLQSSVESGEKSLATAIRLGSLQLASYSSHTLSKAYYFYSTVESRIEKKTQLLRKALDYRKIAIESSKAAISSNIWFKGINAVYAAQIEADLTQLEKGEKEKIELFDQALAHMRSGIEYCRKQLKLDPDQITQLSLTAGYEDKYGGMLEALYLETERKERLENANEVYSDSIENFKKIDLPSRVAEAYWKIARNLDRVSEYDQAARNFENAFAAYKASAQKINQFSDFYLDYAAYMKAWSEIVVAKRANSEEKYTTAAEHYEKAANLLRYSKSWMYLSLNYYAWSVLEQAENLSRKEFCQESIAAFVEAAKFLSESTRMLTIKLETINKADEKDLIQRLIKVSTARKEYCQGRIAVEEAKILDKQGSYVESSVKFEKAAEVFGCLSLDSERVGGETKPLVFLCLAWQKMALAENKVSSKTYEEAAELFRLATEKTTGKSAKLLTSGHFNLCKALEYGAMFETKFAMEMYEKATRYMEEAVKNYLKSGFEDTANYAKATQLLFDAYVFMANAKLERDSDKQAICYSQTEKALQTSLDYFAKAKSQHKIDQIRQLLKKVEKEKALSLTINDIFHLSAVASSTASFTSMDAKEENPVGLERFEHADLEAKLVQHETDTKIGENVTFEIQVVNVGKEPVLLTEISELVPAGFQLVDKPLYSSFEKDSLLFKGKLIAPFKVDEIRIVLKPIRTGFFEIKPTIVYVNEIGQKLFSSPLPVAFNVEATILPGRMPTGSIDLDNLLLGGIPEMYSVVISSPSRNAKEILVKNFFEAGLKDGQVGLYITADAFDVQTLIKDYQSKFYVLICNSRAKSTTESLPNVAGLAGVENLTDIDILLTKTLRKFDESDGCLKRCCIDIVSDVLLQHDILITQKWLAGLTQDLKRKGFSTLAFINPLMHPQQKVQGLLGLFDGEIQVCEKETAKGDKQYIQIRRLRNQRFLETEACN